MKKEEILNLVKKYYIEKYSGRKAFQKGDRINYSGRIFDEYEMINLVDSALDFWLTNGKYCDEFENKLSKLIGAKMPALFVNSGSSANLLAFMTLTAPELKERAIMPGDEVITVACGFPTTVTPIINYGAVPVFLDVTIPQYNIDVKDLNKALTKKTKAIMLAHTLGNPFNIKAIKDFCKKHNLWLIEDNCDALGSKYTIDGITKYTGTWGDIGTSSFYPPHHLTTGEGGAVYTNNPILYRIAKSFRDWGRDCVCPSGKDNFCHHRFDGQFGLLPKGYDHKYVYSHFGLNLKATEMQAAVGVAQLDKINNFIEIRQHNFNRLLNKLQCVSDKLILPVAIDNSSPSWFGFLITCKDGINRNEITSFLERNNVQTRNLFAGNLILHPCFDYIRNDSNKYRVIGDLMNTNKIMKDSFWVGVYPGMNDAMIDTMADLIIEFVNSKR